MTSSLAGLLMAGGMRDEQSALPEWLVSAAMKAPANQSFEGIETPRLRRMQMNRPEPWSGPPMTLGEALGLIAGPVPIARALTLAPKVATGAGALASLLYSSDKAGAEEPDQVKQIQAKLQASGFYRGNIDGRMGPETQRAIEAAKAAEQLRVQQEQDDRRLRVQQEQATGATEAAKAQQAETERLRIADETKAQQREAGNERMRQMESNLSPTSRAIRDYAGPVGYGLGVLAGPALRAGVAGVYNRLSGTAAREAEQLVAKSATKLPDRVARANEFWRRGGTGEVPFISTPNTAPGFAANPNVVPLSSLYKPNKAGNALTDTAAVAGFGGESALGEFKLKPEAEAELHAATQAAAADPSEINIDRLQNAKNKLAIWEGVTNIGRAGALSYPVAAKFMKRNSTVPNMSRAEAEKLQIEELLRNKQSRVPLSSIATGGPQVGVPPAVAGPAAWFARQR